MKTVRGWLTHAFNEIRLEEVPYPQIKPGWAIVKTKVVQPSVTEVQLFYGERSNSYDKVKNALTTDAKFVTKQLLRALGQGLFDFVVTVRALAIKELHFRNRGLNHFGFDDGPTGFDFRVGHFFKAYFVESVGQPAPNDLHSRISFFRRSDTTGANERSTAHASLFLSERGVISGSKSRIRLGCSGFRVDRRTLFQFVVKKDSELAPQRRGT
jgi:hypothetical protein